MMRRMLGSALIVVALLFALVVPGHAPAPAAIDPSCSVGAAPTSVTGASLDTFTPVKSGVTYDSGSASLALQKAGGNFQQSSLGVTSNIMVGCTGDFDGDGWTDFVATGNDADSAVYWYKNQTYEYAEPDWSIVTNKRTPKFVQKSLIQAAVAGSATDLACADLNGDGKQDIILIRATSSWDTTGVVNEASLFLGNGAGGFAAKTNFTTVSNLSGGINWTGTSAFGFVDYNHDGKLWTSCSTTAGPPGSSTPSSIWSPASACRPAAPPTRCRASPSATSPGTTSPTTSSAPPTAASSSSTPASSAAAWAPRRSSP